MVGLKWSIMKKIICDIVYRASLCRKIGVLQYFHFFFGKRGTELKLKIVDTEIFVRRKTPDLEVALSCLSGEFDCLTYLFPADYAGTIIDAGGYIGTSAIALKKLYPNAKIIVIEPSLDNLSLLRKNLEPYPDIKIVHGALVGENGQGTVSLADVGEQEWGYSVVAQPENVSRITPLYDVPAFLLSDLLGQHEDCGLLKLDIEGAEFELLEKDMAGLKKIPAVFAELHDRFVPGCEDLFFKFSKDRILIKGRGEKYLSIKR